MPDPAAPYSIGHVAATVGVSTQTLRVWESKGLITPARTPGGQRRYSEAALARAGQIARLRERRGAGLGTADDISDALAPGTTERQRIGGIIRRARRARGLTIDELASAVGLSRAFVSAVERGETGVSAGVMTQIGAPLGLRPVDFAPTHRGDGHVVRPDDRPTTTLEGGVRWEELASPGHALEPALLLVPPGQGTGGPRSVEDEIFVLILDGELTIVLHDEGRRLVLAARESTIITPPMTISWTNTGHSDASAVWVQLRPGRSAG